MGFSKLNNSRLDLIYSYKNEILKYGAKLTRDNQYVKLYAKSKEELDKWINCFKKFCILTNFDEVYMLKETISEGKFCRVLIFNNLLKNQKIIHLIKKSDDKSYAAKVYAKSDLLNDKKKSVHFLMQIF